MSNNIYYSVDNFNRDIKTLVHQLNKREFDLIIGINRGGSIPAVCLSHALGIPATMVDWSTRDGVNIHSTSMHTYFENITDNYRNILIVDDLIDSGTSMKKLLDIVTRFCAPTVATLLHNTDVELEVDHYYGTAYSRQTEPRYFDFWWEKVNV
jgi:hypoxanthine phosphoribosyltransferase